MGAPETGAIPELDYRHPDGRLLTRLEMDQEIRAKWPKIHWLRIRANTAYGLNKHACHGMTEIVLRHWTLDEMVRRGQIIGDQVGISLSNYEDETEKRQFTQRLAAMIHAGQAITPKEGEGVDMSNMPQVPPPPVMTNGQTPFAPPPMGPVPAGYQPPAGPPGGFQPPAPPFAAGPVPPGMAVPPAPPQQGFTPAVPPQGFNPPQPQMQQPQFQQPVPQQPQFQPPQPQFQQPQMPPMQQGYAPPAGPPGPPMAAPPQAGPAPTGGRGRPKKQEAAPAQPPPPAMPVPPMGQNFPPQQMAPQIPAGIPAGMPGIPAFPAQGGGFPNQAPVPQQHIEVQAAPAPTIDLSPISNQIAQLTNIIQAQAQAIAQLQKQVTILSMGAALTMRAAFQRQGEADMAGALKELGVQVPQ